VLLRLRPGEPKRSRVQERTCGGCLNEALTVTEHDIETRGGSILIRHGKGGRRREVGMDAWGREHLRPGLELRAAMPVGPLLCVIDRPTRGRPWASDAARAELRRIASKAGVRRRFAPHRLRHAHAAELAHEGVPINIIQRQLGHTYLGATSIYLQGTTTQRSSQPSTPERRR
jgi:integrase